MGRLAAVTVAALLGVAACAPTTETVDAGHFDASFALLDSLLPRIDASPCGGLPDYGDVGAPPVLRAGSCDDGHGGTVSGCVDLALGLGAQHPDELDLQLYVHRATGTFPTVLTTGDFVIDLATTRAQTDYATCDVCVRLFGNVSVTTFQTLYMAQSGTVHLTAVSGRLTGSITDLMVIQVTGGGPTDQPPYHTTPVGAGCTSHVTHAAFDSPLP